MNVLVHSVIISAPRGASVKCCHCNRPLAPDQLYVLATFRKNEFTFQEDFCSAECVERYLNVKPADASEEGTV